MRLDSVMPLKHCRHPIPNPLRDTLANTKPTLGQRHARQHHPLNTPFEDSRCHPMNRLRPPHFPFLLC
jgi:hypothetical protein